MDEKSLFTTFWTNEWKTTRKVLARIPDGSDYRPDPKSRIAREIAWQIVCEPEDRTASLCRCSMRSRRTSHHTHHTRAVDHHQRRSSGGTAGASRAF